MNKRRHGMPILRAALSLSAAAMIAGCATMMEGYGPAAEHAPPRNLEYYDEQVRVLRDRLNALEREVETLSRRVEQGTPTAAGVDAARIQRLEARIDEVERGRRADRAVIVDEVIAEIEALLRQSAPPATATARGGEYVVQPGDTLWGIARRFGTSVAEIQRANNLPQTAVIREGQRLTIP